MYKLKIKSLIINNKSGIYGLGLAAEDYSDDKVRYLRISDINDDGSLNNSDLKSITSPDIENYILEENDLVVARTGNSTGRVYVHSSNNGIMAYAGFLIKYVFNEELINPRYMKYFCISDYYKQQLKGYSGSTRGNMNANDFKEIQVFYPERSQQDNLVKFLDIIDNKININNCINDNLRYSCLSIHKQREQFVS